MLHPFQTRMSAFQNFSTYLSIGGCFGAKRPAWMQKTAYRHQRNGMLLSEKRHFAQGCHDSLPPFRCMMYDGRCMMYDNWFWLWLKWLKWLPCMSFRLLSVDSFPACDCLELTISDSFLARWWQGVPKVLARTWQGVAILYPYCSHTLSIV